MTDEPRRLYRDPSQGMLGGVASGLATYLNVDPTVVRIVWILAAVVTLSVAALVYLALWLVMPPRPAALAPPADAAAVVQQR